MVLLSLLLISLEGCARSGFDSEAESAFKEMVGPMLNRRALIITTDKRQYRQGEIIHFWIENRTGKTLWVPNQVYGVRAFTFNGNTRKWETVDLGLFAGTPIKASVLPGVSGPHLLPVWERIPPGDIRLLFVGSTDPSAPGRGGEVYATYADIIELEETK